MRKVQQPWPVNTFASCAGEFLKYSGRYLEETEAWLKEEKDLLFKKLTALPGLKVYEPRSSFILARLTDSSKEAAGLCESMARRGILIRNASNFRFLDRHFFRVAVKDRESNKKMVKTLEQFALCKDF